MSCRRLGAPACLAGVQFVALAALLLGGTVHSIRAQSTSATTEGRCGAGALRCWHLVFGTGDAPLRKAYFADFSVTTLPENVVQINVLAVHETIQPIDHYAATVEFDCVRRRYRSVGGYVFQGDNRVVPERPTAWMATPKTWLERVQLAACDPSVRANPDRHAMPSLGELFRPIDVADLTRAFMWTK